MSRFLLGFAIGAAVGAAVVLVTTPRTGAVLRQSLGERLRGAFDVAREASSAQQAALWQGYRERMQATQEPATGFQLPGGSR